jgi:hypothetical protein
LNIQPNPTPNVQKSSMFCWILIGLLDWIELKKNPIQSNNPTKIENPLFSIFDIERELNIQYILLDF